MKRACALLLLLSGCFPVEHGKNPNYKPDAGTDGTADASNDGAADGTPDGDSGEGGCTSDVTCTAPSAPVCGVDGTCAGCGESADCARFSDAAVCDTTSGACVACAADADCPNPDASACDLTTHACVACNANEQCAHVLDKGVCEAGACVQCTKDAREACKTDLGEPAACNVLTNACDATRKIGATGACYPCVSDAECATGHACVQTAFGEDAEVQGWYCVPSTTAGCDERPFAKYAMDSATIEAAVLNVCLPAYTTCEAIAGEAGYKSNCGVDASGMPASSGAVRGENDLCGTEGLDDGFCVNTAPGQYRCTLPCAASSDCPDLAGVTCQSQTHENMAIRKLCTL